MTREEWAALVWGDRPGVVCLAFGWRPHWTGDRYRHGEWTETRWRWPAEREQLWRELDRVLAGGAPVDLYACPALRHEHAKARRQGDALPPQVLWADCDHELTAEQAGLVAELGALTVLSGSPGHLQVYVLLTRPVDLGLHRRLNRALAAALDADAKWSDETLLRLPGSANYKTSPPTPVEALAGPVTPADPARAAELLGCDPAADQLTLPTAVGEVPAAEPMPDDERDWPPDVVWAVTRRTGDRSADHHCLVSRCRSSGLTLGQTLTVCRGYLPSRRKYGERVDIEVVRSWRQLEAGDNGQAAQPAPRRSVALAGAGVLTATAYVEPAEEPAEEPDDPGPEPPDNEPPDDEPAGRWPLLDLRAHLDGTVQRPEPSLGLRRQDGLQVLYPGLEHSIFGKSEAGKTWFALASVVDVIRGGGLVVYCHFEECDPTGPVEILLALDLSPAEIVRRFRWPLIESPPDLTTMAALLDPKPTLVVLDGMTEAMSLLGLNPDKGADIATFRRRLVKPCTKAGAAVLVLDHPSKNPDAVDQSGSIHKGAGLTGVAIMLENFEPFGRSQRGSSNVLLRKDRPGYLRSQGVRRRDGTTRLGTLVVDDTRPASYPALQVYFTAPKAEAAGEDEDGGVEAEPTLADLCNTVWAVIAAQPHGEVRSERAMFAAFRVAGHKARDADVRRALDDLVENKRVVEVERPNRGRGYKAIGVEK